MSVAKEQNLPNEKPLYPHKYQKFTLYHENSHAAKTLYLAQLGHKKPFFVSSVVSWISVLLT